MVVVDEADVEEQVAEDDAARRDREADGHVCHRPLGGLHPRLAHDLQAVRDCFDARVRAAAQRVCAEEEEREPAEAHRAQPAMEAGRDLRRDLVRASQMEPDAGGDDDRVRRDEDEEDGRQGLHRLLDAAQVQEDEDDERGQLDLELEREPRYLQVRPPIAVGQDAEQRIAAGRDRDGDGQNVVDEQRRAAHHSEPRSEKAACDHVPAAAEREVLDDAAVRGRDDQHREGRRHGQEDGEISVLAQVLERLLWAVRRGGEAVRAETDPGEECRQRDVAEQLWVLEVPGLAEQDPLQPLDAGRTKRRLRLRSRRSCGSRGVHRRRLVTGRPWRRWRKLVTAPHSCNSHGGTAGILQAAMPASRIPRSVCGTRDALRGAMLDLLLVLATVAFFAACWAYVRFCERLGGAP